MNARRIAAAVLALPLVELLVAIAVGRLIGALPTVLLIVAGMVVGVVVLNREGKGALGDLRAAQRSFGAAAVTVTPDGRTVGGDAPGPAGRGRRPADRLLVVLAGLLLLVPGLVSDVLGLALLVPPVRSFLRAGGAAVARRRGWTVDSLAGAAASARIVSSDGVTVTDVRVGDRSDLRNTPSGTPPGTHGEGPGPALGPGPSRP